MMSFFKEEWRLCALALANPATWVWWLAGGLWAWAFAAGNLVIFWPLMGLAGLLALVAMADVATRLLPLLPVLLVAVGGLWLNPLMPQGLWPWLGMALAGGGMLALGLLSSKLAGKPALGGGDIWLAGALGAWLGPIGLIPWLSAIAVLGLLVVACRRCWGLQGPMPFAPMLIMAAWLALLHGHFYYAAILP
jgi:leader peptidase (prepilin peptidase)/N-methyltransferase